MEERKIRVVLYDLDDLSRMGFRSILDKYSCFEILADLGCFNDLLKITGDFLPEIVIADLESLEEPIDSIKLIKQESLDSKILFWVDEINKDDFCLYMRNSVDGLIHRNSDSDQIYHSICSILNGARVYSNSIIDSIIENIKETEDTHEENNHSLSSRESEVLELIVNGRSNDQISKELFISLATTKTHVRNILSKLDVDDRTQAAVKALRMGLFELNAFEREEQLI